MTTIVVAISTWLHSLATVVMIGYFLFTGLIFLPVFERRMQADSIRELLEQASDRLRPFFGGALLIFLITGTHLMLINESYLGLGNFFGNLWSVLIVVKHILVLPFLALAVFSERALLVQISDQKPAGLKRFQLALHVNLLLGALIMLLTSVAQAG